MSTDEPDTTVRVRTVLSAHARLEGGVDSLSDTDSLYEAGMSSHASVNVMLALEDEFDIEFPDDMLSRGVFDCVASIRDSVTQLQG